MCVSINGPGDLETGMRVASKVGNLLPNFGTLGLWVLELFGMYAMDERTDGQRTDGRTDKRNTYCPFPVGGGITISNQIK